MATTKLTEFNQSTHIVGGGPAQHGICYYICDYVQKHKDSPWSKASSFNEAKAFSTRLRTVPLVAAGKAANSKHFKPQNGGYADATPLKDNAIYRVEVAVGTNVGVNHETMMMTGNNEIILFDPNFGFFHIDTAPVGHVAKFEQALTALYGTTTVTNFGYSKVQKAY
jgi:hypothetical protein